MPRHLSVLRIGLLLCALLMLPLLVTRADVPSPALPSVADHSSVAPPPRRSVSRALAEDTGPRSGRSTLVLAADEKVLNSIADVGILEDRPDLNVGGAVDMWVGYDEDSTSFLTVRSLVTFDIASIPPGAIIESATLRLFLTRSFDYDPPRGIRTVTIYRVASAWSEGEVTWGNAPQFAEAYSSAEVVHHEWRWYDFDVTGLVAALVNGTFPNHGMMMRGPEHAGDDSSYKGFSTREGTNPPQLVVRYVTEPSPTPTETATPLPSATPTLTNTPGPTATSTPTLEPVTSPPGLFLPLLFKVRLGVPIPTPDPTATTESTATTNPTATASPAPSPSPTRPPEPARVIVAPWCCQFDAPDDDNNNLNEEYVCFANEGGAAADMGGWYVMDNTDKTYTFPAFTLAPGAQVRLRTGSGANTQTDLYWGQGRAVWNNDRDIVYLYDSTGQLVDRYDY